MTVRVQGGLLGILSAIDAGRLDPLDPWLPEERRLVPLSNADRRARERRAHRREKRLAARPAI